MFVAPALAPAIPQILIWLGLATLTAITAVTVTDLVQKSRLGSKMKQYVLDHVDTVLEDLKKSEPRECTPYTHPQCFDPFQSSDKIRTKGHKKIANNPKDTHPTPCPIGSIWSEDWLHCNHFEVFEHERALNNDKKYRQVWIDGRTKK